MGIDIVYGPAKLTGKNTVQVGDRTLETRYVLLCTGSRAPQVPGPDSMCRTPSLKLTQ